MSSLHLHTPYHVLRAFPASRAYFHGQQQQQIILNQLYPQEALGYECVPLQKSYSLNRPVSFVRQAVTPVYWASPQRPILFASAVRCEGAGMQKRVAAKTLSQLHVACRALLVEYKGPPGRLIAHGRGPGAVTTRGSSAVVPEVHGRQVASAARRGSVPGI